MALALSRSSKLWGYTLAVIGSACYGLNPLFALPLYETGLDPISVLLYRYLLTVVMLGGVMLATHEPFGVSRKQLLLSACMGLFFAGSSISLFYSFKFMDAGIASVILFTYPMMVVILSWLVFHEKMSKVALACIAVAFAGICCLHQPSGGDSTSAGVVLAFVSGLTYAIYLVGVNRSVLHNMSAMALTLYASLTGVLVFIAIAALGDGGIDPVPCASAWLNVTGLALFPTLISLSFVTRSIHIIGSTPASIIGALEPITALAVSLLVFGGMITPLNWLGFALVLGAVCLMVWKNH